MSDLTCKWCDKSFRSERTLGAHMCPRKRRWSDRNMTHTRLAFRVFQMFYDINTASSKPKSQEDFIRSQYYEAFVRFGRSCVMNEYLDPEQFARWLITEGKKIKDWPRDSLYNEWLLQYVKRETGLRAMERTVMYLAEWSEENQIQWSDYFRQVSTNRAVHDIRAAKVSPWALYLSESGPELLTRLNDEQIKLVSDIIDADFWLCVFKKNPQEVEEVQMICQEAGL